jgi:hypothetical protein
LVWTFPFNPEDVMKLCPLSTWEYGSLKSAERVTPVVDGPGGYEVKNSSSLEYPLFAPMGDNVDGYLMVQQIESGAKWIDSVCHADVSTPLLFEEVFTEGEFVAAELAG